MSSVVIAGNTSGTVTLDAPAVAGTTVLTLPTTSGTVLTQNSSAPANSFVVDASGNVGIGTATPNSKLHVSSGAATITGASSTTARINMFNNAATTGGLLLGQGYASGTDNIGYMFNVSNAAVVFGTNDTERIRIDSGGNVLIGATSLPPSASATRFYVVQPAADYSALFSSTSATAANNYGPFIRYTAASPNNGTNEFLACVDSSVTRMTVRSNGGIANYSANNVNLSDQREKTNIELAGSYLDKICAIPVKTFNYIDQNIKEDDGLTLGVIAQDVQAVAPELVMESDWGTKEEPKERLSIYQTDLQYALMKCIQELKAELDTVKAELATLKGAA